MNSISWLAAEVFFDIIDNDCFGEIASRPLQVFNVVLSGSRLDIFDLERVLAVKTMGNGAILVQRVQNLVGVLYTTNKKLKRERAERLIKSFRYRFLNLMNFQIIEQN